MNRLFDRDIFVKLFSLFLAVVIWFVVDADRQRGTDTSAERIFMVVPKVVGLSPGLALAGPVESVRVRLRGPLKSLEDVGPRLEAEVDVSGKGKGNHVVPVYVTVPGGLWVSEVVPERIEVVIRSNVGNSPR